MRVMIFSMPRSGTSILSSRIKEVTGIRNLNEAFGDPNNGFCPALASYDSSNSPTTWINQYPEFVVKLLATNLWFVSLQDLVNRVGFTDIVVIKRNNLTDCCASLILAEQSGKYHYNTSPAILDSFVCSENAVRKWCKLYNEFVMAIAWLDNNSIEYKLVNYEDMLQGLPVNISGTPIVASAETRTPMLAYANIDYQMLCSNYDQVSEWINQWTS